MRPNTPKRAAYNRACAKAREEYLMDNRHCMVCGGLATEVHEIARGPARKAALAEPCAWLSVCTRCNTGPLTDATVWPVAKQLGLKAIRDLDTYDRRRVNELRGRQPDAITEQEVIQWIVTLI